MWNVLQVIHEGTEDVKEYKINMLKEEYELFHVEPNEIVEPMQTHFLHLINKLENLGKSLCNKDCANFFFEINVN